MKHTRLHRAHPGLLFVAVLGLLLTTLLVAPVRAQSIRYFMKFGDLKGSSVVEAYKGTDGWIEISAYSFSAGREITGTGTNREASSPNFSGIQCTGRVDGIALPGLLRAGLFGNPQPATLVGVSVGQNPFEFLKIVMTGTFLTEISLQGTDGDNSIISLLLKPATIQVTSNFLDNQGNQQTSPPASYDFLTRTGS